MNHESRIRVFFIFSFLLLNALGSLLYSVPFALAQGTSFTISPPRNDSTLSPGQTYTNDIQVTNNNDTPLSLTIEAHDFIVSDTNGTPYLLTNTSSPYSVQSWITFSPQVLSITPHQHDSVSYTVTIPNNAQSGGHYGIFLFTPIQNENTKRENGTTVSSQIAALVNVHVLGNIREKARITHINRSYNWQNDTVQIQAIIQNQGNTDIKPIVFVSIAGMFRGFVGTRILSSYNIFPGASRVYTAILRIPWWLPGKYTIKIGGSYGQQNTLLAPQTQTFWAVSEKCILLILLTIIFWLLAVATIIFFKRDKHVLKNTPPSP